MGTPRKGLLLTSFTLNTSGSPACSQPRGLLRPKTFYHFDKADLEQSQRDYYLSCLSSQLVANTGSGTDPERQVARDGCITFKEFTIYLAFL